MLNETSSKKSRNQELQVLIGGAKVTIEANLGVAELTLREVLDLKGGDIIRLNANGDDIVSLSVDGKERFLGEIGLRRFRKSIKVTEIIYTERDDVKRVLKHYEDRRKAKISGVKDIMYDEDNMDEELEDE
jgi:flagellar motor switch protein FliM